MADNSKLDSLMQYLLKAGMAKDLNNVTPRSTIPTGCPPLNYVLGHNGVPEGVLMEVIGPESSGKCVDLDTLVEVQGLGLIKLREKVATADLPRDKEQNLIAETQAKLEDVEVGSISGYERADGVFFAGKTPTITVWTRESVHLSGTPDHRVLVLTDEGNLRWTALRRPPKHTLLHLTEEGTLCEEPPSERRLGDKIVARIVSALDVDPGSYVDVRLPLDQLLTTKSSRSHFRRMRLSFADDARRSSCRDDVVPALRTTYAVQVDICGHCKETSQRSWNHVQ